MKKHQATLTWLIFLLFLGSCTGTRKIKLEDQILAVLEHPQTRYFYTADKIPEKLLKKAKAVSEASLVFDGVYAMENAGDSFGKNCDSPDSLLNRRLVFLASSKKRQVLCYERGGRAHNLLISYFQLKGRQYYNLLIQGIPASEYNNFELIHKALKEGNFKILYNNGKKVEHRTPPF